MTIWDGILKASILVITTLGGFYCGLKIKKPVVVIEYIDVRDNIEKICLKNIGDSPAVDIKVHDATLTLKNEFLPPLQNEPKGTKILFKFDKIKYVEPHKTVEVGYQALINGEKRSVASEWFYSAGLGDFKFLKITYKDNFGILYRKKSIDNELKFY